MNRLVRGTGYPRQRQAWLLVALILVLGACGKKKPPSPAIPPPPTDLEIGEQYFQQGNYTQAARAYERYLEGSASDNRDLALFHLGISYTLADERNYTRQQIESVFERLIDEFPGSSYVAPARSLIRSLDTIKKLEGDLHRQEERLSELSAELNRLTEAHNSVHPLELGEHFLRAGQYARATEVYEAYIMDAEADGKDEAYFRLAMIHALPDNPLRNPQKASELLQTLIELYPGSPYTLQAEQTLALQKEIARLQSQSTAQQAKLKQLSRELEELKAIDLKRRQPR